MASLDKLDREALVQILTQPKNALVKQYEKLFSYDGCTLEFEQDALYAIADLAIERKTGARGLRAIMENILQDTMFNLPSQPDIVKCTITKAVVTENADPVFVREEGGSAKKTRKVSKEQSVS